VAITGGGFSTTAGATTAQFGTTPATNVSCSNVTACMATGPAGNGVVDVRVTVAGVMSPVNLADEFSFISSSAKALILLSQPQRLVDARSVGGPIAVGSSRCFPIAGQGGIPADAAAAILNVTAVSYTANSWLTLFPNGQPVPSSSTVNF